MSAGAQVDPWAAAAKNYKPQQGQSAPITTSANDDWKIWQGSNDSPAEKSGIQKFGESLLPNAVMHPIQSLKDDDAEFKAHPIKSVVDTMTAPARGVISTLKNSSDEQLEAARSLTGTSDNTPTLKLLTSGHPIAAAKSAVQNSNPAEAGIHALKSIPILGTGMVKAAEQAEETRDPNGGYGSDLKNVITNPGAMGTLTSTAAQVAPLVLGATDAAAPGRIPFGQIPTRARAGALFNTVSQAAQNEPVNLTRSQANLQRMAELAERGGGTLPSPVNQLLNRSQRIAPLTYPEARDFQSGLGKMSRADADMSGPMDGQFKQLRSSLFSDVGDAAESVGQREAYEKAMRDYARASAIRNGVTKAAKYAIPAAAGTVGVGGLYHAYHSLFGGN